MSWLSSLFSGGLVITDGAWGTELQKRGLALHEMSDLWNLTRPGDVEAVAEGYVEAGSRLILTNTFRSNPVSLDARGLSDRAAEINRRGAVLSRNAAGEHVRVLGSMGPTGKNVATGEVDSLTVVAGFRLQAEGLAEGGVDALMLETFGDIDEARLAVRAVKPVGLPIVVSFAFFRGENMDRTVMDATPELAGLAMAEEEVDAVGANCGLGPDAFVAICARLKATTGLPIWIKPNAGLPTLQGGRAVYSISPSEFAGHLPALVKAGASFLGGCCGTDAKFVRALVEKAASCTSSHQAGPKPR